MILGRIKEGFTLNRSLILGLIFLFFLSLAIRLTWTMAVQRPGDAIYSDMKGYIVRAQDLISGTQEREHNITVIPYGAHYFYAMCMLVFGKENYTALAVINAVLGAASVVLITLAARRCFRSSIGMYTAGLITAFWYPFITTNGFFSSEIPFAFFLYLGVVLTFRYLDTGKGYLLTGLIYGIAFTMRPQMLMTALLFIIWVIVRRRNFEKLRLKTLPLFALPIILILGYSAYRYHYFTGEYKLISGNATVTKLFGATKYAKVVATEVQPNGKKRKRSMMPPSARNLGYTEVFNYDGYIGDSEKINAEIKAYQSKLTLWGKIQLKIRNVSLLAYRNTLWPERNKARSAEWRKMLFDTWPVIVQYYWFPLACIGLLLLIKKRNVYLEVLGLSFVTMLYAAYAYIGEIRYRTPYDPMLTLFAIYAVFILFRLDRSDEPQGTLLFIKTILSRAGIALTTPLKYVFVSTPSKVNEEKRFCRGAVIILSLGFTLTILLMSYGCYSLHKFGLKGIKGTKVYYDASHGARHLWNRDNKRFRYGYHAASGFSRFYKSLQEEGFEVYADETGDFDRAKLDKYDIFFVGEQTYHSKYMTDDEQKTLMDWVHDGGCLVALAEHTNAHYMGELLNGLFKDLPLKVRYDSIMDLYRKEPSSRTTWVTLSGAGEHPLAQGIKEYHFMNGASIETEHGVLFSADTSWSDMYNPEKSPVHDGNRKHDPNEISGPLAGAAAIEYGKGKVIVIGDHNAFSNPNLYYGDHYRFIFNCMNWLAGERYNKDVIWFVIGAIGILVLIPVGIKATSGSCMAKATILGLTIAVAVLATMYHSSDQAKAVNFLIHTGNGCDIEYMTRAKKGYYAFYGQFTKEPQLYPWANQTLRGNYDALFLTSPVEKYSDEQLAIIDNYLSEGKPVVYLARSSSLESEAGQQLQEKFGFKVKINKDLKFKYSPSLMNVQGKPQWVNGIFRFYRYKHTPGIEVEGLEPLVSLADGDYRREKDLKARETLLINLLSSKKTGRGQFILLAPMELYDNKTLSDLYKDGDVIREQMAELVIRLAKFACRDDTVYYKD